MKRCPNCQKLFHAFVRECPIPACPYKGRARSADDPVPGSFASPIPVTNYWLNTASAPAFEPSPDPAPSPSFDSGGGGDFGGGGASGDFS